MLSILVPNKFQKFLTFLGLLIITFISNIFFCLCFSWYILACVIFPTCFYIPKWFELTLDVPRACDKLKYLWECLNSIEMNEKVENVKDLKIDQIKSILAKLMSIYCWRPVMETDLVVKQVRKKKHH